MHVFQKFSGDYTPGPPFGAVIQNRVSPLQNPGCKILCVSQADPKAERELNRKQ